jgi:predicted lipid-binding transport protein (Tim44 family)
MDGGYQIIDILLFAAIAGFLVFRLRSVLGRRTGVEQRRNLFPPSSAAPQAPPSPAAPARPRAANGDAAAPATGLAAVKAADPSFAEDTFLKGARGAFEIIVNGFAASDKGALQPLLSTDVFASFAQAIDARIAAKETLQTTLITMKTVELVDGSVEGATVFVTVKFVSDQTNVTRDADGKVVDGDPAHVGEHIDLWTFARPLRARDPNWTLVATHSP